MDKQKFKDKSIKLDPSGVSFFKIVKPAVSEKQVQPENKTQQTATKTPD